MLSKREIHAIKESAESSETSDDRVGGLLRVTKKLIEHIEFVGEFAPDGPPPESLDEAIAKARGWNRGFADDRSLENEPMWLVNEEKQASVADYRPSRNLGQALEAAADLGVYVSVQSSDGRLWTTSTDIISTSSSAVAASYAICRHLYDVIRARRSELPFEDGDRKDATRDRPGNP